MIRRTSATTSNKRYRPGRPAAPSMTSKMMLMTIPVPKSGCFIDDDDRYPGHEHQSHHVLEYQALRVFERSRSEKAMMTAGVPNWEGWSWKGPIGNHRRYLARSSR